MEDDCPQGGDDVRLCLLKTLGAHNQRQVPCIACHKDIIVYDKYPLIDGTFFLSPVLHHGPPIEVMYEGRKQYLQQICVSCLWSDWKCNNCGRDGWFNGRALILGTLYYYDIISAGKCCPPTCTGNYSLMNELVTCSSCGCKELHCIRDTADVTIAAR
ncbi:unnamed protein product [Auanema sp. JU1783]|nr:unnamed protein product [Auanema sp. JU1783]